MQGYDWWIGGKLATRKLKIIINFCLNEKWNCSPGVAWGVWIKYASAINIIGIGLIESNVKVALYKGST